MNRKISMVKVKAKWVLPFFLFTFLPFTASAQRLTIEKATIDCGRTGYEQPVTATFELRNKGIRRLVIESVHPDCGCTSVEYPKEVGAGDKFTIKMTYDARQLGHYQKMAAITSNGSKKPVYLTMKGIVLPEVLDYTGDYPYEMGELLLDRNELVFDDVNKGDFPILDIHILNNGTSMMTPNVQHMPPYLSAIVTPERLAPGRAGTISVSLNSNKLRDYGLTQTKVYIAKQLGEKISGETEMDVSAILLPDMRSYETANKANAPKLEISATEVDFTDFNGKTKKTESVTLRNAGATDLKISSLQMFTTGLKVTLSDQDITPGQTATLKITGEADDLKQLRTMPRILMITNDPDHAKVIINIKVNP